MTTQADIKLVIDQLQDMELATPLDEITIYNATDALEALGNKVAAQAAVIELLREALHITANSCQYLGAEKWGIVAKALSNKTDSAQILQEWLDEKLGEPASYEFQDTEGKWRPFLDQRHFDNTKKDGRWPIRELYVKPEIL